jgi:Xaa-Pro aminopeptidase
MRHRRVFLRALAVLVLLAFSALALERQPAADYRARRVKLSQQTNGGTVVMFAATEQEGPNALYGFRQDENFYYLSGWSEPGAAILISPAMPATDSAPPRPYTEILFLPARNRTQERWTGPKLTADDPKAAEKTGFDRVANLDQLRDELVRILPQPRAMVYSDLAGWDRSSPATMPLMWQRRANAFPNYVSFEDAKPLINRLRVIKDAGEIALIRKATDASVAAHQAAMREMRPGITEREISALMQYEFGKRGCERPAYAPIVGSGFYSTVLHYSENAKTVEDGDVVVLDVGGEYSMYASDITRTLPANGKFTARQREIYDIVLGAQQAAMDAFVAGKSTLGRGPNSLHRVAMQYINSHGKDENGDSLGKYFIHGLSHFVGLNVHDPGDIMGPLQPGAVFTIEPGIYIPEEKLGVRIEDIFLVDADGKLVNLSGALPRTAADVERAMAAEKARR